MKARVKEIQGPDEGLPCQVPPPPWGFMEITPLHRGAQFPDLGRPGQWIGPQALEALVDQ